MRGFCFPRSLAAALVSISCVLTQAPFSIPPVQGDACETCPTLQGEFSDVVGVPGKPGAKGDRGPLGVGQPGKPVSAPCSPPTPAMSLIKETSAAC